MVSGDLRGTSVSRHQLTFPCTARTVSAMRLTTALLFWLASTCYGKCFIVIAYIIYGHSSYSIYGIAAICHVDIKLYRDVGPREIRRPKLSLITACMSVHEY